MVLVTLSAIPFLFGKGGYSDLNDNKESEDLSGIPSVTVDDLGSDDSIDSVSIRRDSSRSKSQSDSVSNDSNSFAVEEDTQNNDVSADSSSPSLPVQEPTPTSVPAPAPAPKTVSVNIDNFAFGPQTITINKGDAVIFTNSHGVPHTVTSDVGAGPTGLDSGNMNQSDDYKFTFNDTGTYRYHCAYHPSMRATVVVE